MANSGWRYGTVGQTAGGADKDVQFNKSSALSGSSNLTFNYSTNVLSASHGTVATLTGTNISASKFYGDGGGITGVTGEWDGTIAGAMSGGATLEVVGKAYFGNTVTATGSISGTAGFAGHQLIIGNAVVIDKTKNVSNVGNVSASGDFQSVGAAYFGNTVTATGSISGTAGFAGHQLIIGNAVVIDKTKNIANVSGISGSGALQAVGKTYLGNTLDVTGNVMTAGTITIGANNSLSLSVTDGIVNVPGKYSGSSTLETVGKAYFGHNVYITGGVTAQALVAANAGVKSTTYSGSSTLENVGAVYLGSTLGVTGAATFENTGLFNNNLSVGGAGTWYKGPGGGLAVAGYMSGSGDFQSVGAAYFGNTVTATGSISGTAGFAGHQLIIGNSVVIDKTKNIASVGGISGSGNLQVVGTSNLQGNVTLSGSIQAVGGVNVGAGPSATINAGGSYTGAAYSGSSTLQAVGAATLGSTLNVSGAVTLAGPASGSAAGPGSFLGVTAAGLVVLDSAGGGSGDFSGPGSATDNAIVRFNGTGGKTGQNSGVLIDDNNDMTAVRHYSGSGTFETVGKAYFGHNVYVTGGVQAEALVAANAGVKSTTYSGSSTLEAVGATTLGSTLDVSGNVMTAGTFTIGANNPMVLSLANGIQNVPGKYSGSSTLENVGAAYFGSDLKATGSLRAKQIHITRHYYVSNSNAQKFIPFSEKAENSPDSGKYYNAMIAPFDGRLMRLFYRAQAGGAAGTGELIVGVHTGSITGSTPGTALTNGEFVNPGYTGEQVVSSSIESERYSTITINFTASQHFTAGEIVGVSIDPNTAPNNATVCCVWEYDMSSFTT
jgi:hypothetical protein